MPRPPRFISRRLAAFYGKVVAATAWVAVVVLATAAPGVTPGAYAQAPALAPEPLYRLHGGNGLPHNTVYDLHFDAEGWLWLATAAGLYRYDGVAYVHYGSALARHREIHNIQTAPDGTIYCQNFRKQIFRVEGDSLAVAVDLGAARREFATFATLPDGLAAVVEGELYYAAYADLADVRAVPLPTAQLVGRLGTVYPGGRERVLLVGRNSRPLATFDGATVRALPGDGRGAARTFYAAADGDYVLRVEGGGALHWQRIGADGPSTVWTAAEPGPGLKYQVCRPDASGALLVGTDVGLWARTPAGTWERRLAQADVANIATDGHGQVWVATLDRGVVVLPARTLPRRGFPTLPSTLAQIAVLPGGTCFGVTRTGVAYRLADTATRLLGPIRNAVLWHASDSLRVGAGIAIGSDGGLRHRARTPIQNHNLLKAAVAVRPGVEAYSGISGAFVQTDVPGEAVFAGVRRYGPRLTSLRRGRSSDLDYDAREHRLYVAFADSLVAFGRTGTHAIRSPLLATAPTTVDVLGAGEVVVGTSGDGLVFGTRDGATDTLTFRRVGSVTGTQVEAVAVAGARVWAVTEAGLFRCVRSGGGNLSCEPIGAAFGLPAQVPSAVAATDTRAYVAYETTVYELDAGAVAPPPRRAPRVSLARVEVAGKSIAVPAAGAAAVTLLAQTDAVALQPRAPVYGGGEPPAFRYRVGTLDTVWHTIAGEAPELFFGSLPRGRHVIELAVDAPGAPVTELVVEARLALWRRPLTIAALGVALAASIALAVFSRARRRAREARREAELRRATLTAIASQMNPHFIFNALNAIQEFVIDEDPVKANTYLSRFAKLMRLTLEHSRAERVPLRDEVEAMRLYSGLEELRHDGRVRVTFAVDDGLPMQALLPPLLVQPHIENAFKHGVGEGVGEHISVSYRLAAPMTLLVEVRDDGVGRDAARARRKTRVGRAFGASASAQRAALLAAADPGAVEVEVCDLFDGRERPAGTLVRIRARLQAPLPAPARASISTAAAAAVG